MTDLDSQEREAREVDALTRLAQIRNALEMFASPIEEAFGRLKNSSGKKLAEDMRTMANDLRDIHLIFSELERQAAIAAREGPSGGKIQPIRLTEEQADKLRQSELEVRRSPAKGCEHDNTLLQGECDCEPVAALEDSERLSDCCKAEVRVGGGKENTCYYVCSVCEKACGTHREDTERPDARRVVIDFLDAWRFCPVASSPNPSRQCLENAATQLLNALDIEFP